MCKRKEPLYIDCHINEEGGNNTHYTIEQEHKHIGTIMIILLFAMLFVQNPYGVRCRVERDVQTILSKFFLQNCARASKSRVKLRWLARKHVIMARATGEGRERFAREGWGRFLLARGDTTKATRQRTMEFGSHDPNFRRSQCITSAWSCLDAMEVSTATASTGPPLSPPPSPTRSAPLACKRSVSGPSPNPTSACATCIVSSIGTGVEVSPGL